MKRCLLIKIYGRFKKNLPEKEDFYGHLSMKDITDADYTNAKTDFKDFEIKKLEYYVLYVQSKTLLLADIFESSPDICLETHKLDPARFLTAHGLA